MMPERPSSRPTPIIGVSDDLALRCLFLQRGPLIDGGGGDDMAPGTDGNIRGQHIRFILHHYGEVGGNASGQVGTLRPGPQGHEHSGRDDGEGEGERPESLHLRTSLIRALHPRPDQGYHATERAGREG